MKVSNVSHTLYDFVNSVYDMQLEFATDGHMVKCLKLVTIATLFNALHSIAWHEHTSDWDLCIVLTLIDGETLTIWSIDLSPFDGMALCVDADRVTAIRCQVFDDGNSDNERWLDVAIDSIESVSLSSTAGV